MKIDFSDLIYALNFRYQFKFELEMIKSHAVI